jgi:hypothetical protein
MSVSDVNSVRSLNESERNYMRPDDGDHFSVVTDTTVNESMNEQLLQQKHRHKRSRNSDMYDSIKAMDSDYHKIVRRDGDVKIKTEVYSTSIMPGTFIRDAITGYKQQNCRVGSWKEDLFFKVHEASGHIGTQTYVLFYDSPEQFERHMKTNVSTDSKRIWTDKFARARDRLEKEQQ